MTLPTVNLLSLPDGAGYVKRHGRTHLYVQRKGGSLHITAASDSIPQQTFYYERKDAVKSRSYSRTDMEKRTEKKEKIMSYSTDIWGFAIFAGIILTITILIKRKLWQ
ncbi:hypothetical protein HMPREF0663_11904 [Hoylesella oralis ATCC 33269]|uniref:Uncharacterized protein n=1 Tax=Hoylesella oralis ATCC 33269 TaxID=873533 RepID=E7RRV3_9BACT|nr:hypothetical protein [Hoylesella oralis]EFZ36991.1 hypothetical protein HMPREF0663_11904 [Hoylesella oralis ATCC 33269]EPH18665.1 hypothetical protein HMPREF1475_00573 [Hoylesella oralis HGA0225]SHF78520.1 hypothetical protein SAMN05444288_1540 [Hoylesella oralis]